MIKEKAKHMSVKKFKKSTFQIELTGEQLLIIGKVMEEAYCALFNEFLRVEDLNSVPKREKRKLYNQYYRFKDDMEWIEDSLDVSEKVPVEVKHV